MNLSWLQGRGHGAGKINLNGNLFFDAQDSFQEPGTGNFFLQIYLHLDDAAWAYRTFEAGPANAGEYWNGVFCLRLILQHPGNQQGSGLKQGLAEDHPWQDGVFRVMAFEYIKVCRDGLFRNHDSVLIADNPINPEEGRPVRNQGGDEGVNGHGDS